MNFGEMRAELAGRGFNHLSAEQLGRDINEARQRLDNAYLWGYREAPATGTAPLTIVDLGVIEAVTNETRDYQLVSGDFRSLLDDFGDLSQPGMPQAFYVASGNTVATVPTNGDVIGVQYYRVTPDLEDDLDVPLAPSRFHMLIVDMAAQRAYLRTDNAQAAQALQPWIEQGISGMVDQLLGGQQIAGPMGTTGISDASCDW